MALGFSGAGSAQLLSRPEGEFRTFIGRLEYDPARSCYKPTRPYSDDSYARQAYIDQAKRHMECLNAATENDLKYAEKAILAGHKKAVDEFLDEVRRGY
ncbi:hypothetical protein BFL28_11155 [Sphingomonas turrisvirgatae]|uniref:Uncharacterized protein n=2 Tax=Sphingomonas turrisvirgatae TaxID=1888892 RepID=A0A1E3M071_9SPHN|nr:hypothetical protein BFL28_11155 [Sphingomonas turrisvirgatae]